MNWQVIRARQIAAFFPASTPAATQVTAPRSLVASRSSSALTLASPAPPSQLRASRVKHPKGLPVGCLLPLPTAVGNRFTPALFLQRTLANATTLVWHSVQATTRDAYSTAWNHWNTWAAKLGTDRYLRTIPDCWSSAIAVEFSFGFAVAAVISFVAYLGGDLELKPCTGTSY